MGDTLFSYDTLVLAASGGLRWVVTIINMNLLLLTKLLVLKISEAFSPLTKLTTCRAV